MGRATFPPSIPCASKTAISFSQPQKIRCTPTGLNGLTVNPLTYVTVQAKADVNLSRVIAFSGLLLAFTTGSCEV